MKLAPTHMFSKPYFVCVHTICAPWHLPPHTCSWSHILYVYTPFGHHHTCPHTHVLTAIFCMCAHHLGQLTTAWQLTAWKVAAWLNTAAWEQAGGDGMDGVNDVLQWHLILCWIHDLLSPLWCRAEMVSWETGWVWRVVVVPRTQTQRDQPNRPSRIYIIGANQHPCHWNKQTDT